MDNKIKHERGTCRKDLHRAFLETIRAELRKWARHFGISRKFTLASKSLLIDVLVIKKDAEAVIGKNFARNLRLFNIIEYKSPGSYVSTGDFHKVYAYALLYSVLHKKDLRDIA